MIDWDLEPLGRVPDQELAEKHGVTVPAVRSARARRHVPAPFPAPKKSFSRQTYPDAAKKVVLRWYAAGKAHDVIAELSRAKFGHAPSIPSINTWAREAGLPPRDGSRRRLDSADLENNHRLNNASKQAYRSRKRKEARKRRKVVAVCACGCGEPIYETWPPGNHGKYVSGHNTKAELIAGVRVPPPRGNRGHKTEEEWDAHIESALLELVLIAGRMPTRRELAGTGSEWLWEQTTKRGGVEAWARRVAAVFRNGSRLHFHLRWKAVEVGFMRSLGYESSLVRLRADEHALLVNDNRVAVAVSRYRHDRFSSGTHPTKTGGWKFSGLDKDVDFVDLLCVDQDESLLEHRFVLPVHALRSPTISVGPWSLDGRNWKSKYLDATDLLRDLPSSRPPSVPVPRRRRRKKTPKADASHSAMDDDANVGEGASA